MKLAEALMLRADYQTKIYELKERIRNNVKVQEGEEVSEDPEVLIRELKSTLNNLEELVIRINRTNAEVMVDDKHTLADWIAKRDTLKKTKNIYNEIIQEASFKQHRMMRTEVKFMNTVNVVALQKEMDALAKAYRELDVKLQEKNWTTDLI